MKSIKPGRGPSMMSGVMGIFVALFGVLWTIVAAAMGAYIMIPFGLIFISIAVIGVVYNLKNATSRNRYSAFDITDEREEPDPFNQRFGHEHDRTDAFDQAARRYCPSCGVAVDPDDRFCRNCGNPLT